MRVFILPCIILMLSGCLSLGGKPVYQDEGIAIEGYDAVAYFSDLAVKGLAEYSYHYQGATWQFSSLENRELFVAEPQRYLPQYGGYCAYAMSKNFVVSSDPLAYTLHDGKLYLNYSFSVRDTWREDIPGYVKKADDNWQDKTAEEN